jgi:hypothetical protein
MQDPPHHPYSRLPPEVRRRPDVVEAWLMDHDREIASLQSKPCMPRLPEGIPWLQVAGLLLLIGIATGFIPAEHLPMVRHLLGVP